MKKRLDVMLCEQNSELTRAKAQSLIMSGVVYVNNQKELKAGSMFTDDAVIEIRGETLKMSAAAGSSLKRPCLLLTWILPGRSAWT